MEPTKKEKLLNKIRNLLDLAEDKNSVHEAEAAAKKAQALIMKYNIEEAELAGGREAKVEESLYELFKIQKTHQGKWVRSLFSAVARFNFCEVLTGKRYIKGERRDVLWILGEADNIELVRFLSEQLVDKLRDIYPEAWDAYTGPENRGVYKRGFFRGAVRGIYLQLQENQQRFAENETTAIVISNKNEKVQKYMKKEHPNLGKTRTPSLSSRSGYADGVEAGKNVDIQSGLKGSNKSNKQLKSN